MPLSQVIRCLCVLVFAGPTAVHADDMSAKIKTFCNDKIQLTEDGVNFSVKQLVTLGVERKSTATLDSVGAVEISIMHLNCNLFVAQMITQQQFLEKQTEILQFAVDLEALQALAAAKTESQLQKSDTAQTTQQASKTADDSNSASNKGKTNNSDKSGSIETTKSGSGSTEPGQSHKPSTVPKANPGESVIKSIAVDLGITLKSNTAVSQSGRHDLVSDGVAYLITKYSPIPVT